MNQELRLRAFFAVRAEVEGWELIRDLASALDAVDPHVTSTGTRSTRAFTSSSSSSDGLGLTEKGRQP